MTGLQAEGVIEKALFVCGAEGSWPSPEAHVAAALTEQWNDAANVFCLAPGTVVAYKCLGGPKGGPSRALGGAWSWWNLGWNFRRLFWCMDGVTVGAEVGGGTCS